MSSPNPNVSTGFVESPQPPAIASADIGGFSNKTIVIIVLCIIILLLLLNSSIGNIFRNIGNILYNLIMNILALFGLATGTAINTGASVAGNVARTGVNIGEGTLHSIGNILTGTNQNLPDLDKTLNISSIGQNTQIPSPDTTENPIQQRSVSQDKTSWCLVGEYKGRRGCIDISEHDKCMSGQVYPTQKMCLNPTLSANP